MTFLQENTRLLCAGRRLAAPPEVGGKLPKLVWLVLAVRAVRAWLHEGCDRSGLSPADTEVGVELGDLLGVCGSVCPCCWVFHPLEGFLRGMGLGPDLCHPMMSFPLLGRKWVRPEAPSQQVRVGGEAQDAFGFYQDPAR